MHPFWIKVLISLKNKILLTPNFWKVVDIDFFLLLNENSFMACMDPHYVTVLVWGYFEPC